MYTYKLKYEMPYDKFSEVTYICDSADEETVLYNFLYDNPEYEDYNFIEITKIED